MTGVAVKTFLDTSVLIAALVSTHKKHAPAFDYMDRAQTGELRMIVSTHAVAEVYATLPVLQVRPRITATDVQQTIQEEILAVADVVSLNQADYEAVIARMARLDLVSGAIYDGLHVRAAEKAEADELVACNGRDFRRAVNEVNKYSWGACRRKVPRGWSYCRGVSAAASGRPRWDCYLAPGFKVSVVVAGRLRHQFLCSSSKYAPAGRAGGGREAAPGNYAAEGRRARHS